MIENQEKSLWKEHTEVKHNSDGSVDTTTFYPSGLFIGGLQILLVLFLIACFLKLCWDVNKIKKALIKKSENQ